MPELSSGAAWPFEVIGIAFGLVGVCMIVYAYDRHLRADHRERWGRSTGVVPLVGHAAQARLIWSMQTVTARMSASSWPGAISIP